MPLTPDILDAAYAIYDEFGPALRIPRPQRLKEKFPELSGADLDELLKQMDSVTKTVWKLAERGGEAKMKKGDVTRELQAAHPFLKGAGLKRARFMTIYYAWHEGYA